MVQSRHRPMPSASSSMPMAFRVRSRLITTTSSSTENWRRWISRMRRPAASLFLGEFKAQAADQDCIAKARAQIINGVFRQRRAAIDKIGGVGRSGRVERTHPDAKQAKSRAIGFVL